MDSFEPGKTSDQFFTIVPQLAAGELEAHDVTVTAQTSSDGSLPLRRYGNGRAVLRRASSRRSVRPSPGLARCGRIPRPRRVASSSAVQYAASTRSWSWASFLGSLPVTFLSTATEIWLWLSFHPLPTGHAGCAGTYLICGSDQ